MNERQLNRQRKRRLKKIRKYQARKDFVQLPFDDPGYVAPWDYKMTPWEKFWRIRKSDFFDLMLWLRYSVFLRYFLRNKKQ